MAEDQEKNRVRMTKDISEAKKKMEEQQQKLAIDMQKKEKIEFLNAKQRMLDQLKRDKEERFGKKFGNDAEEVVHAKPTGPQGIELVKHGIKTVKLIFTEDRQPGVAKTCFKTCHVYLGNVLKDSTEEKYKRINLSNEAFQKRVCKINGGLLILKGAGFVEQPDNTLLIENFDMDVVKEAIRLLESNL